MKKLTKNMPIYIIAISIILLIGCKETPKEEEVKVSEVVAMDNSLTDEQFNALWENIHALWEKQDPALIHSVYADKFIRISPGGTSTNDEELTKELNNVGMAFPGLKLNLKRYDLCDNMASVHWSVSGDFTGEIAGLKGNGKPYDVIGISVFFVVDGKIVNDDSYWDTYAVFAQTGGYKIVEDKAK
jgi:hypothetical protein